MNPSFSGWWFTLIGKQLAGWPEQQQEVCWESDLEYVSGTTHTFSALPRLLPIGFNVATNDNFSIEWYLVSIEGAKIPIEDGTISLQLARTWDVPAFFYDDERPTAKRVFWVAKPSSLTPSVAEDILDKLAGAIYGRARFMDPTHPLPISVWTALDPPLDKGLDCIHGAMLADYGMRVIGFKQTDVTTSWSHPSLDDGNFITPEISDGQSGFLSGQLVAVPDGDELWWDNNLYPLNAAEGTVGVLDANGVFKWATVFPYISGGIITGVGTTAEARRNNAMYQIMRRNGDAWTNGVPGNGYVQIWMPSGITEDTYFPNVAP